MGLNRVISEMICSVIMIMVVNFSVVFGLVWM